MAISVATKVAAVVAKFDFIVASELATFRPTVVATYLAVYFSERSASVRMSLLGVRVGAARWLWGVGLVLACGLAFPPPEPHALIL
jgi:hypothetical protein